MTTPISGWGSQEWGAFGWGGPITTGLELINALAIAENVVQLQFNLPIYFSGLQDPPDASNPSLYAITPIVGTVGYDGTATRPVSVATVALSLSGETLPAGAQEGTCIDLTLDRMMTPFSSQYTILCSTIYSDDLSQALNSAFSQWSFYGLFKGLIPASIELPTPTRDLANPQTSFAAVSSLPVPTNPAVLGVFSTDDTGDYAFDSGMTSFKKRIYRRLVTIPGGFLHLGQGYGVGVPSYGKKLARAATVQAIAGNAETQIGQEPETAQVSVTPVQDPNSPGLVRFNINVKTKGGKSALYTVPFQSG